MTSRGKKGGLTVLLTNDDGISAIGLMKLEELLSGPAGRRLGIRKLRVVAPSRQCTGGSRAVTFFSPLFCRHVGKHRYEVDGTPADCAIWGLGHLLKNEKVDLVISGINHGPNLGEDIQYSGTLAAALEAARMGVPALALSLALDHGMKFADALRFIPKVVTRIVENPPPKGVVISINFPGVKEKGVRITRPGQRYFVNAISERKDPFGGSYYWLAGVGKVRHREGIETDIGALSRGYISITPLDSDLYAGYTDMAIWKEIG